MARRPEGAGRKAAAPAPDGPRRPDLAVLFWSETGNARRLAGWIAEGAEAEGARPWRHDLSADPAPPWARLAAADALVMGAPTFMGSLPAPFKAFMDASGAFWADQPWQDKLAAGFTVAMHPAGDKLGALQQLAVFAAQHGMLWIGQSGIGERALPGAGAINADGSWLGLTATEPLEAADARTARAFGARIAAAARRWGR